MTTRRDDCPCGRDAAYDDCCGPYHRGASPRDAETLMRSRYAAFVKRDVPYLHRTLHPSHDDGEVAFAPFEASMKKHFASGVVYRSLSVLGTTPDDDDGVSKVLFVARLAVRGKDRSFAEVSSFARVDGEIRYITGITMPIADVEGLSGAGAVREAETRHAARSRTPRG